VNLSAADGADAPPGVVTVTSTVPALPAGAVAVTELAESAVMMAGVAPNVTAEADERLAPLMVTEVPPAVEPAVGLIPATEGTPKAMAASIEGVVVRVVTTTGTADAAVGLAENH
jgi:hypothetical protein